MRLDTPSHAEGTMADIYIYTWLPFGHYLICFNSWIFDFRISWTALAGWGGWTSLDCAGLDWTGLELASWAGWTAPVGIVGLAGWVGLAFWLRWACWAELAGLTHLHGRS